MVDHSSTVIIPFFNYINLTKLNSYLAESPKNRIITTRFNNPDILKLA